ncbi:helix-turn-helix domain-containing protein [Vibrio olivae]|uniref:Helix-turn-helix domain-containing protein n=1 Tax=Vibrio olivae TaxID=1243002 RepID=A0ABV5HN35_9VIBR
MYIVRSGAADKFSELVTDLGQNPIALMNQVGLTSAQFRDPDTYIASSKLAELLEIAALYCQQPCFGILLAQRQSLKALGDLPMLVARASTVGEALKKVNEYLYLHSSGVRLNIHRRGEWIALELELDVYCERGNQQLMQMSVAQLAKFVSSILNIDYQKLSLYLQQPYLVNRCLDNRTALPEVRVNQSFNGVLLKSSLLESKNYQDQQALDRHFQEHVKYLKNHYPNNLIAQTRDMIGRLLPSGECCIERVAKALDLHPRTFQLRLKDCGSSYSQLLQNVRRRLAEQLLKSQQKTITDIALQLGYSEIAVFSRHFKLWTGLSPSQWRKQYHISSNHSSNIVH